MTYGCKAVEVKTGDVYHITGTYESIEAMEEALLKHGFVVVSWWKVEVM